MGDKPGFPARVLSPSVEISVQFYFGRLFPEHDLIVHHQIRRMTDAEFLDKVGAVFYKTHTIGDVQTIEFFFKIQAMRTSLRRDDQDIHNGLQQNLRGLKYFG